MNNKKKKFELGYKGIENFLRRISFNLGNSPSQTEVKLISCVRVDLADLQQKIICLEQELRSAKGKSKNPPTVRTVLCETPFRPGTPEEVPICDTQLDDDVIKENQQTTNIQVHDSKTSDVLERQSHFNTSHADLVHSTNLQQENQDQTEKVNTTTRFLQPENLNKNKNSTHENFLQRQCKSNKIKYNNNTKRSKQQLIYYAHTSGLPRYGCNSDKLTHIGKSKLLDRNFTTNMHYNRHMKNPYESNSEFSSPICRDLDISYPATSSFDTDICSCCHGMFRNIDHELTTQNRERLYDKATTDAQVKCNDKRKEYYNSKFYDLIPVKEKSVMHKYSRKTGKDKENNVFYSENFYEKSYFHDCLDKNSNVRPKKIYCFRKSLMQNDNFTREIRCKKIKYNKNKLRSNTTKKNFTLPLRPPDMQVSTIQQKTVEQSTRKNIDTSVCNIQQETFKPSTQKNVECWTHNLNNTECQTVATKSVQLHMDSTTNEKNITEVTLNQIRNILQSVLHEVKTATTTQSKNKPKKDTYMQKGSSQNAVPTSSRFIKSFTYSPYDIGSCVSQLSDRIAPGTICSPIDFHYLPNYPVLVQPSHKLIRQSLKKFQVTRSVYTINPTDVTTNTEFELIKQENSDVSKDIRNISHYDAIQEVHNTTCSSSKDKSTDKTNIISNINYEQFHSNSTTNSQVEYKNYDKTSTSEDKVITPSLKMVMSGNKNCEGKAINLEEFKHNSNLIVNSEPSGDEKEIEEQTAVLPQNVIMINKKSGIFRKMLSSVRKLNAKEGNPKIVRNKLNDLSNKHQESFGNKTLLEKLRSPRNHKINTKRESIYNCYKAERYPNMEQEYRRSWEENLTFHSETPHRGNSSFEKSSCFRLLIHPKCERDSVYANKGKSTENTAKKTAQDEADIKLNWWKRQNKKAKNISELKNSVLES